MKREKLVVPIRRLEEQPHASLCRYDSRKVEQIKVRDEVSRLVHVKELEKIDNDLKQFVKRLKSRRLIGLIYQVSILKIHLSRLLRDIRGKKRAHILGGHIKERHLHLPADLHGGLHQNQNLRLKSQNVAFPKRLPRDFKSQSFA
ncbi:hypothetical protein HWI79_2356 [Cryptosporidium felis]|nr:hypothetical protein HWI79_2356 [Cryptosporidium felis]